jgi:superfamily II DNA or RNA helicase
VNIVNLYEECGILDESHPKGLKRMSLEKEDKDDDDGAAQTIGPKDPRKRKIRLFNRKIVKTYQDKAKDRKSTVVFSASLHYVKDLVRAFRAEGIPARSVCSKTSAEKRSETIESFKKGDFPVLVNCQVLKEGCDLPAVSVFRSPGPRVNLTHVGRLHHSGESYQQCD